MKNAISIFSGAGGLDMGLINAGYDVKLSVELEKVYCNTLKINHPDLNVYCGDVTQLGGTDIRQLANLTSNEEISLIAGGSPCQSFSTAGKRLAFEDPRGAAMLHFVDLINDLRPQAFILENVKGILSAALKHRPLKKRGSDFPDLEPEELPGTALEYLLNRFKGYKIEYKALNAADFGVPQKRERVFFIGIREDLEKTFEFPKPTHNENGENGLKRWVSFGDVTENLATSVHEYTNYSSERLKFMQLIPRGGGNWRDLRAYGEDVVKAAMKGAYSSGGGKVGFFRRLYLDRPAPTLLTSPTQNSTNLGHPLEDRPLSIQEYLVIQQFPKDYVVSGSLNEKYIQIGNAVPVDLATVIARKIYDDIIKLD